MKRFCSIVIAIFVCTTLFASTSLEELFPSFSEQQISQLREGAVFEAYTDEGDSIAAISPLGSFGRNIALVGDRIYNGFALAGLSFIPFPEKYKTMDESERKVELFNLLRSISTQKGIKYISHLAGEKPVVLFEDSYMISNPDDKKSRIADPISDSVPEEYSCYSYQKDNRFGKNVYSIKYSINGGDFLMDITNYTAMKYMGFSCVEKGTLHMYLEVIETDEGFVLYTVATVYGREPQVKVLFITVDLPSAFMRRITALKEWFEKRIME